MLLLIPVLFSCENAPMAQVFSLDQVSEFNVDSDMILPSNLATAFDYPVGRPDARGYYNAQPFGKNTHLGDDWNALTGGNTDLGDTIYAIANGYINFAEDIEGGWGNVVRISHYLPNGSSVESLYAHCDRIIIAANQWVNIGEPIATIGTANDQYSAHLHLEIRERLGMPIGGGYSSNTNGYLDPTEFINNHRRD